VLSSPAGSKPEDDPGPELSAKPIDDLSIAEPLAGEPVWKAVKDSEGETYFFNTASNEAAWTAPEAGEPHEPAWKAAKTSDGEDYYFNKANGDVAWTLPEAEPVWKAAKDSEGETYFFNTASNEAAWTAPEAETSVQATEPIMTSIEPAAEREATTAAHRMGQPVSDGDADGQSKELQ